MLRWVTFGFNCGYICLDLPVMGKPIAGCVATSIFVGERKEREEDDSWKWCRKALKPLVPYSLTLGPNGHTCNLGSIHKPCSRCNSIKIFVNMAWCNIQPSRTVLGTNIYPNHKKQTTYYNTTTSKTIFLKLYLFHVYSLLFRFPTAPTGSNVSTYLPEADYT